MILRAALLGLLLWPSWAAAIDLNLPGAAQQTITKSTASGRYAAPVAPFSAGQVPSITIDGHVRRTAWRIQTPGLTPLQVMNPLRAQLETAGFEVLLDCAGARCGGFDFRFAVDTLPDPHMHVNLRSFHFVTAVKTRDETPEHVVTLLVSTSAQLAFVQIIQAGAMLEQVNVAAPVVSPGAVDVAADDFSAQLLAQGHVVLGDLAFDTGSSDLGSGPFASLEALAAFLKSSPSLRVAMVGHTDSVGALESNIALSRKRAQSVRARLVDRFGINGARIEAQGMGYLAPVASNLAETGREANRRVEVILLSQ